MPEKVSLKRSLGVAGKDTIAIALISRGAAIVDQPPYYPGAILIAVGVGLLVAEKYLVD